MTTLLINISLRRISTGLTLMAIMGSIVACTSPAKDQPATTGGTTSEADTQTMSGMKPGMSMAANPTDAMMTQMAAHMDSIAGMNPTTLRATLPMHRQMVANMIAQMNQEMKDMQMTMDTAWTSTVDSLRQDLIHFPEMSPTELKAAMPAHNERLKKLIQMHHTMMQNM